MMVRPRFAADRGIYIGLSRDAAAVTNAPPECIARAQDEGLPVEVRNDEAVCVVGGSKHVPAQASPFVAVSGAGEVLGGTVDPAPAPDARHSRFDRPLAAGETLSADGDRLSPRRG